MAKVWCFLFGHIWKEVSDWTKEKTTFGFMFYCERCGKTGTSIEGKNARG